VSEEALQRATDAVGARLDAVEASAAGFHAGLWVGMPLRAGEAENLCRQLASGTCERLVAEFAAGGPPARKAAVHTIAASLEHALLLGVYLGRAAP
jgi:hypothetical protein